MKMSRKKAMEIMEIEERAREARQAQRDARETEGFEMLETYPEVEDPGRYDQILGLLTAFEGLVKAREVMLVENLSWEGADNLIGEVRDHICVSYA